MLTSGQRIHRVFHRLGIVTGGLLSIASVCFLVVFLLNLAQGPRIAEKFTDLDFYSIPRPTQVGNLIVYRDGSSERFTEAVQRQNEVNSSKHIRHLTEMASLSGLFAIIAVAIYLLLRAVGWVVAGGFPDRH